MAKPSTTGRDTGHCQACRWWQSSPSEAGDPHNIGLCLHEELVHFELQVSGDSGCNRFEPAKAPVAAEKGAGI